jgi:hypothetical protein
MARLHSKGRLLALPTNISIRWNELTVTNSQTMELMMAVKSFVIQGLALEYQILEYL